LGPTGPRDVDVMEDDPALGGPDNARACIERRRLPGAVRADEPGDRSRAHGEADLVNGDRPAVTHGQILHGQAGRERWPGSPSGGLGSGGWGWGRSPRASATQAVD